MRDISVIRREYVRSVYGFGETASFEVGHDNGYFRIGARRLGFEEMNGILGGKCDGGRRDCVVAEPLAFIAEDMKRIFGAHLFHGEGRAVFENLDGPSRLP